MATLSHQFTDPTPPIVSPRTEESLHDLQRRRDQALAVRNETISLESLKAWELRAATLHGNATEMLRCKRALRDLAERRAIATAEYESVVEEIQELIAAELGEVA